ncbi:MAG: STAS/SEC14 domain-containing protein [Bacteroidota bacterium]
MFTILDFTKHNLVAFKVKGKIEKSDYDKLNALLDKNAREYDAQKVYLEIEPENIEGLEPQALWEDIKTFFKHIRKLEKLAIVGDSSVVEKTTQLSKPFVSGEVRYFPGNQAIAAKEWIKKG